MPQLRKQYISVVDSRTTMVCLDAAGQIRDLDEPFETLAGPVQAPPTHIHCRATVLPYLPGVIEEQRGDANAEIRRRPRSEKRKGPDGYEGPIPPPAPSDVPPQVMRPRPEPQRILTGRVVAVRASLSEWDPLAARLNRAESQRGQTEADPVLALILAEQGFDAPPRVVSDEQATRLLRNAPGSLEVWRGLVGEDERASVYAEQFRSGPLRTSAGIYGHGTYWATSRGEAAEYADEPGGVVLRAVLLATARVIEVQELDELMKTTADALTPAQRRSLRTILDDPGRFAAALGFDAVLLPAGVLVLNRSALVVVR